MIILKKVCKVQSVSNKKKKILKDITLHINRGDFAILIGQSGAGKSTLLNIICALETPELGSIKVAGTNLESLNDNQLTNFRKRKLGFVFQFYNLIPNLTVKENVELVARMSRASYDTDGILRRVGLSKLMDSFPHQLSGGEQQRVAIARAIVKKPKILLCDEPTGALDKENSLEVLSLIQELSRKTNMTTVMATHNRNFLPMANKIYELSDGSIIKTIKNKKTSTLSNLR